jgi:hypothetical protein
VANLGTGYHCVPWRKRFQPPIYVNVGENFGVTRTISEQIFVRGKPHPRGHAGFAKAALSVLYVENLTKSANRKWESYRPEIESHSMGPCDNAVYQISKGCDKWLLSKLLRKFPTINHKCHQKAVIRSC